MEFSFIYKDKELQLFNQAKYSLINIDNQTSLKSALSTMTIAGSDGDIVTNAVAEPRDITLDIRIMRDVNATISKLKEVFKLNGMGILRWTQDNKPLDIKAYVEEIDTKRWTDKTTMQVKLHCPDGYWQDINYVVEEIEEAIPLHYFTKYENDMLIFFDGGIPFGEIDFTRTREINNTGDATVGMECEIVAYTTATNPKIINQNEEYFQIGTEEKPFTLEAGDRLVFSTIKNQKRAYRIRGDRETSLLNRIAPGSTWIQLEPGENTLILSDTTPSTNNLSFSLQYKRGYV